VRIRIRALVFGMATAVAAAISPGVAAFALPSQASSQTSTPAQAQQPPSQGTAERGNPSSADNVRVWVNTASGIYHCPATHWYGKTKSGQYLTQKEAQQKGYRPAYHRLCK
jgi:hypothetical protein